MNEPNSAVSVAEWISSQLNDVIDNSNGYETVTRLEELLEELLKTVSKKFKIPEGSFKVESDENTEIDRYGEEVFRGKIKLNGVDVINYTGYIEAPGFGATVNDDQIRSVLEKFLRPTLEARIMPFKTWLENKTT